jgi:hypothetical protein
MPLTGDIGWCSWVNKAVRFLETRARSTILRGARKRQEDDSDNYRSRENLLDHPVHVRLVR